MATMALSSLLVLAALLTGSTLALGSAAEPRVVWPRIAGIASLGACIAAVAILA